MRPRRRRSSRRDRLRRRGGRHAHGMRSRAATPRCVSTRIPGRTSVVQERTPSRPSIRRTQSKHRPVPPKTEAGCRGPRGQPRRAAAEVEQGRGDGEAVRAARRRVVQGEVDLHGAPRRMRREPGAMGQEPRGSRRGRLTDGDKSENRTGRRIPRPWPASSRPTTSAASSPKLDGALAERIGRAVGRCTSKARRASSSGRDMRESASGSRARSIRGIRDGLRRRRHRPRRTPMQYFACGHVGGDGGVKVTASHNPASTTASRCAAQARGAGRRGERPADIERHAPGSDRRRRRASGRDRDARRDSAATSRSSSMLRPGARRLLVAVDCGNGMAGVEAPRVSSRSCRSARIAPLLRARRHVPEPRAEPAERREPADLQRDGAAREEPTSASRSTATRTAACFVDENGEPSSATTSMTALLAQDSSSRRSRARRSSTTCAPAASCPRRSARGRRARSATAWATRSSRRRCAETKARLRRRAVGALLLPRQLVRGLAASTPRGLVLCRSCRATHEPFSKLLAPLRRYPTTGEINFQVEDKDGHDRELIEKRTRRRRATTSTASRSSTRTGGSTSASPTPSRCCVW